MKQFNHLVYAGTFDRLHTGHKKMLDRAFELAEKVSIGITGEKIYNSKPLANLILTWQVRKGAVQQYLEEQKWLKRAGFFRLDDIYGPSIVDETIDSILVTDWTKANAEKINKVRTEHGMRTLRIIVDPLVRGDDGEVVTSERIRMGEIDREGKKYRLKVKSQKLKVLLLPEYLRQELRKPLGRVFYGSVGQLSAIAKQVIETIRSKKPIVTMVISVGDIITESLLQLDFDPNVKIIDLRSRRKQISNFQFPYLAGRQAVSDEFSRSKFQIKKVDSGQARMTQFRGELATPESISLLNDPGTINIKTALELKKSFNKYLKNQEKQLLVVRGEEDLLALSSILFAPLGAVVLYGQMDLGVVMVEVTEEKKWEVREILKRFI
ncbi:hypothetical protein A2774_00490 [Candidatus Roizmanbacteria bacterium RIFCSPHIGHO2_01_FULL_39_12c]|uniref:Cytidyltransferase-like domain-containing protein n=1 Tax=Candidatus Roizmanbacteria bacterium RIFCSPHIGHO2_01_FULL_39_12c TaxID=1802031 RepID=A0A1F7G9Y7_9BACT|nr:MAG: hypothetical protein A2774_00490 [Candidatus Roizmanbacteria bacterium RIFCSPHIGHO2_01_FULL_39_12c]OGK46219.1 MAG: hypothetical protein A2963_02010 [Candidatus Roizmanbacteria bacterium RIFCSPLOWO2_01_FULL_40_13]